VALDDELATHVAAITATVAQCSGVIEAIAERINRCFESGGKLLVCGNGGSAADAQHFVAEFVNGMRSDRRPLPALALTTDTSVMTSVSNDSSYDMVFARQLQAIGRAGDVLIALSTSGRSANILAALRAGRDVGLTTIGFTGQFGVESMSTDCDVLLVVPSGDCQRIQECHEFVYHVIAAMVERELLERLDAGAREGS
jgi:D-sedoheptulose 7-phosphate isomerase